METNLSNWVNINDHEPVLDEPVVIKVNSIIQDITYCLDGSDLNDLIWFEPYCKNIDAETKHEMSVRVSGKIEIFWQYTKDIK